jgi:hypothetical protein
MRAVLPCVVALTLAASELWSQRAFRTSVDLVQLEVSVMSNDRPVAGLTAADFEVTDNNIRQTILDVTHETVPIDVTLVVDVSASVEGRLLAAIVSAAEQIRRQLRDDDRLAIISFNERITERLALSTAGEAGRVDLGSASGWTALDDAIAAAIVRPPLMDRRQMALVFTDGFDTISFLDDDTVLDLARRSRTAVFAITAAESAKAVPVPFFEELTRATGGMLEMVPPYETTRSASGAISMRRNTYADFLDDSFVRAFEAFRTSYVLHYVVEGTQKAGWHDVSVRVTRRGRYQIRARTGYDGG